MLQKCDNEFFMEIIFFGYRFLSADMTFPQLAKFFYQKLFQDASLCDNTQLFIDLAKASWVVKHI
jgi:hypothetical protein